MSEILLTPDQRQALQKHGDWFKSWIKTEEGKKIIEVHREHERYFKDKLSKQNLQKMTESDFVEFYKKLWASNMWTNKDRHVKTEIIQANGLEKIKQELQKLLYDLGNFANRYNEFKRNISGFGSSTLSEILHFVYPDKYCLWNDKPKTVLPRLGIDNLPDRFFKYQIAKGEDYIQCVQLMAALKSELSQYGVIDFIDLDIFLWHIFDNIDEKKTKLPSDDDRKHHTKIVIDSHESAEYHLLELGKMLGFDTYTADNSAVYAGKKLLSISDLQSIPPFASERDLKSAREIDVIWFGSDENPEFCFEVENTTNILTGLNRFYQIKEINTK